MSKKSSKRFDVESGERLPDFLNEWRAESDRANGIMAGALLDELLLRLLKHAMIRETPESTFDLTGPAGSFSTRIKLAYAMGLISASQYQSLNIVRGIRNDFAHHIDQPYSFETPAIRSEVFKIPVVGVFETAYAERCKQENPPDTFMVELNETLEDARDDPREYFDFAVSILAGMLHTRVNLVPKAVVFAEPVI